MTSNDQQQYLTVDMFNSRMDTLMAQIRLENEKLRSELKAEIQDVRTDLHSEIQGVRSELHNEIQGVRSELKAEIQDVRSISLVNSAKIDMLQHTFYWGYWGFAIMTVVIAIVAVIVPYFLIHHKEKQQENEQPVLTEQRVQDIVAQALSNLHSGGKTAM